MNFVNSHDIEHWVKQICMCLNNCCLFVLRVAMLWGYAVDSINDKFNGIWDLSDRSFEQFIL